MRKYLIKVGWPILALLLCAVVIQVERNGVKYEATQEQCFIEESEYSDAVSSLTECIVLTDSRDTVSGIFEEMMCFVLDSMRISYAVRDLSDAPLSGEELAKYRTAVLTVENWDYLGETLPELMRWVREGGRLMNTSTPLPTVNFQVVASQMGICEGGTEYTGVSGFYVLEDFMIGANEEMLFHYLEEGEEPLQMSLAVLLDEDATVYMESEAGVPLLWSKEYGEGRFVFMNETIVGNKYQRGFLAAAYSLLEEACIYPVINASAYYLDDFPSPVPSGSGQYIQEEYGMDIASFYLSIWWADILELAETYGIPYTGLIIEDYSDSVEAPFPRTKSTNQFKIFGNMLLNAGGELGLHGYNHQSLCLEGENDDMQYGTYKLWPGRENMKAALEELLTFSQNLFPQQKFKVYVPPSNIISEESIEVLTSACPDIRVIASIYLEAADTPAYVQEFEVDEDGMIHTPRVVSGFVLDEYQMITAMAELNFHYVQSHFCHPDDVLDEDRGAALGWGVLSTYYENYLAWVKEHAWNIRNVTGTGMGIAVQQYDALSVDRRLDGDELTVRVGGFSGDAYFMLRLTEGEPSCVEGATLEQVTDSLYLVHAVQDEFVIILGDES